MALSSMAEQKRQMPPKEQQYPCALIQESPQPNDLNKQQAKAPNSPSYKAYDASYFQQQRQYDDYSQTCPHHQLDASQIHTQGHRGGRGGGEDGRGHDGGIKPDKSTPLNSLPAASLLAFKIYCEICRVECNSLKMLENHKNGKKHKKIVQSYKEMRNQEKIAAKHQANLMPDNAQTIGRQQANVMPDTKQTIECQQANIMSRMHESGYQQEKAMPTSTMHSNSVIDNAPSVAEQGHRGGRGGGEDGRGHDGGIKLDKSTPLIFLPAASRLAFKICCEICRVECNSLKMLEQHKNGKKHRKIFQTYKEMQNQEEAAAEHQANLMSDNTQTIGRQQANAMRDTKQTVECQQENVMPSMHASGYQQEKAMPTSTMHSNSVIDNAPSVAEQVKVFPTPESVSTAEASPSQLKLPKASEIACNNFQVEDANKSHNEELERKGGVATAEGTVELPNSVEQEGKVAAVAGTTELPNSVEQKGKLATIDGTVETVELSEIENNSKLDAKQGGMKRIISDNASQGGKRLKKSKQEPRRICTVCNVACETLMSFDAHIEGKKHRSKLQRLQQHGTVFGPIAVYIPPNQPIFIPTNHPDPLYYGLSANQIVCQVMNGFDSAHLGNLWNSDAHLVFEQKKKTELEDSANNVSNYATQESDSKEIDNKLVDDDIGVHKRNDDALTSESKDIVKVKTGDVNEILALDSGLNEEKCISDVSDTSKVTEDFALDSASK